MPVKIREKAVAIEARRYRRIYEVSLGRESYRRPSILLSRSCKHNATLPGQLALPFFKSYKAQSKKQGRVVFSALRDENPDVYSIM